MEYNELKVLHQISESISCSLDLDQILGQIIDLVVQVTGGDSSLLYLIDENREFLVLRASKNPHPQLIGKVAMKVGEGITGWVAREAVPVAIEKDAMKDERFKAFHDLPEDSYEAFLSVPIIDPMNVVIGVINVQHRQAYRYSESERTLLAIIGHQVGGAIANARLYAEAKRAALLESQLLQSQKMEAVGRLAGGIAHDFNNLLTVIMGRTQLLIDDLPEGRVRNDLHLIFRSASRAAGLTQQLLAFSRRQVLQTRIIDLNAVVLETEKMLARVIGENIRLAVRHEKDLGTVKADPGQIEQVILNLVVNARDAMPNGGKITIETANLILDEYSAVQHKGLHAGSYVMLAVSDTGVGMDAATQARIFEPFFTTKELGKGTGLGLATAYGIVEQSGGHIWVYSEPNKGTTFKVYFPRVDALPESAMPARPAVVGGTESILLVEDEQEVRNFMFDILKMHGYSVLPAANASDALGLLAARETPVHMTITDIIMPGMSGWALAQHLRVQHPDMKILYVSGYTDAGVVDIGALGETDSYLQKPLTKDTLVRKVRKLLDGAC